MGAADTLNSLIKSAAGTCKPILGMLLGIMMISASNGSFAQDRTLISFPIQDLSSDRGISEEKITRPKEVSDAKIEKTPANRMEKYPYFQRPAHYTLLTPRQQCALQDVAGGELPQIPSGKSANLFFSQDLSLNFNTPDRKQVLDWRTGSGKSYLIPALEISGFILALNGIARLTNPDVTEDGKKVYSSNFSSSWDHLVHGPWVIDTDGFGVNQLNHSYQGAIYQNLARSTGLGFWESAGYTFMGSFLWEIGGETTKPSINDQIASGIAGNFLGEPLFRMASLLLEHGDPGFWRELGAALISPPTGFNRLVFGDRFGVIFPSHDPPIFWRVRLGATRTDYTSGGNPESFEHNGATADFSMTYGLPGKPGYPYNRPFDYFQFELTTVSNGDNSLENLMSRGLLLGKAYEVGESFRGIWGLYGSYDYISPRFFRVSSTALSFGTTGQWWLSRSAALQSSALVGMGYGAAGNISGEGQRDYHYGATGQGLLALRLILGDVAMLEATLREYYISDLASTTPRGSEIIGRLNLGLTFRIYGHHAIGVQYLLSARDGDYVDLPNQHQRMGTFTLVYTLLSDTRFGAVEWRKSR